MVEVLKKGLIPNSRVSVTCTSCTARLLYDKLEGRFMTDDRDGDAYVFRCPECANENWIAAVLVNR